MQDIWAGKQPNVADLWAFNNLPDSCWLTAGTKGFYTASDSSKIELPVNSERVAQVEGFSLHAGVIAEAQQRDKLEKLCRYISRSAVSEQRLALTNNGKVEAVWLIWPQVCNSLGAHSEID